jgi:hypothetical protein
MTGMLRTSFVIPSASQYHAERKESNGNFQAKDLMTTIDRRTKRVHQPRRIVRNHLENVR